MSKLNGKRVAIVLGNRINDDGTFTQKMVDRLTLVKELYDNNMCDLIICSGGVANKLVPFSEAEKMKEYLCNHGLSEYVVFEENKSNSTYENAVYSVPIAKKLGANTIIVVSSGEHFSKYSYNVVKFFASQIKDENIRLMIYTDGGYEE